jgi:effector-binding domain-containing protein
MPIGRFASAARLSIKSLRNYDESGLLPAAFVDPDSGYRYYRLEQLARAEAIRSLRLVNMPLSDIEATLDADDPEPLLRAHLASLAKQREDIDLMTAQLQRRIDRREYLLSTEVTIKATAPVIALTHRTDTTYPGIFEDIPAGFETVIKVLEKAGVDPVGPPFTRYHRVPDADTSGNIEMCIPVATVVQGRDGIEIVEIDAHVSASIIHRGSYEDMGKSYNTVAAWIHERGHRIIGPHREVYLNSPADVDEDDLLTEVLFPIDADEGL